MVQSGCMTDVSVDLALVAMLDYLAHRAWLAQEVEELGPWKLRYSSGLPQAANSVLTSNIGLTSVVQGGNQNQYHPASTAHESNGATGKLIELAESFYHQRQQSASFYISPTSVPSDLDATLARRGYEKRHQTLTWISRADALERFTANSGMIGKGNDNSCEMTLEKQPSRSWIDVAFANPLFTRTIRRQLSKLGNHECVFASLGTSGQTLATALAIAPWPMVHPKRHEEEWAGIYCVATRENFRRRGMAKALLHALAGWSLSQGRTHLFLQVDAANTAAIELYRSCGFRFAYAGHCRVQPV